MNNITLALKQRLRHTPAHWLWLRVNRCRSTIVATLDHRTALLRWRLKGRPTPPPSRYKQEVVKAYAACHHTTVLIETGTFRGDMIWSCRENFQRLISVELDPELCAAAQRRFSRFNHVQIVQGDSALVLPQILATLEVPALFWLDGHFSGGTTAHGQLSTPIARELDLILRHSAKQHVILIDDARCFTGENDYPRLDQLVGLIKASDPSLNISVEYDIIRIHR